jgi:lipoprotein-anchoring transpeptidase ErfK/SrfK
VGHNTTVKPGLYALFAILALAGCGGEPAERRGEVAGRAVDVARTTEAKTCAAGSYRRLRTERATPAAVLVRPAAASRAPGGEPTARFGLKNVNGAPTVLGVLGARVRRDCSAAWYRVQLPVKPNGATGWIRAENVELATVRSRIVVDLSERTVTLLRDGRAVFTTRAAIGSPATPTPTGAYYVNQRLVPTDPTGPFGPGAIGISAFSEVLTGWTQGGPVAIHGTNRPDLIGQAVSNGCIRVRNDALRRLWRHTLAGTPVVVRA